ncbi:type IV pilus modification PilV family protein [Thalassotalea montiporae]
MRTNKSGMRIQSINRVQQCQYSHNLGFTLIELIIGIVVLSISFSVITSLVMPATVQSANQLQQVRAAELAQTVMNDILARSFDENSDHAGGIARCGEPSSNPCTAHNLLVSGNTGDLVSNDGESNRTLYDDVDDYLCINKADPENPEGLDCADLSKWGNTSFANDLYTGFRLIVDVFYDGDYDGVDDGRIANAKLIELRVIPPDGDAIVVTSYKVNF